MEDLLPVDMLQIELVGKAEEEFFIRVDSYPSKLKIGFTLSSYYFSPVDFEVSLLKL